MNKKGSIVGWLGGLFFLLVAVGLIVTVIIISNQEETTIEKEEVVNLYISSNNLEIRRSVNIDYEVFSNESGIIKKGKILKNSFEEVEDLSALENITILCGGQGYYHEKIEKSFTIEEIQENLSKVECQVNKIGQIKVSSVDKLLSGSNYVDLNVSSISEYRQIGVCVSWTEGIININSNYNETIKPERLRKDVDKCYDTQIDLKNNDANIRFIVKAGSISDDKITFYIFDKDYNLNRQTREYEYMSEFNGNNLGSNNDLIFEIN